MPIYAYRCSNCGHAEDVLQKMSDAPLTTCPACHQATYAKQVTAAGFQLKGSGWYVTDFRNSGSGKTATSSNSSSSSSTSEPVAAPTADTKAADTKPAASTGTETAASS